MKKCYVCGEEMYYGNAMIKNYKFGDSSITKMEKAMAYTCLNCGEVVLDSNEAKRLQNLSKAY